LYNLTLMHEHFDAHIAYGHAVGLAQFRRLAGTPGEAAARDFLVEAGNRINVPMSFEEFSYSRIPFRTMLPSLYVIISAFCVLGSLAYLWGSSLVGIPGAAILLASFASIKWSEASERFATWVGSQHSANLVGEIKASGESRGTVILCAHYDAKSQLMPSALKAALFVLGFCGATVLGLALLVVGLPAAAGKDIQANQVAFYISLIPALLLFALVFDLTGNNSPGALDDASGEAVILEAARILARQPLENLDVLIISFACEEIGLIGSIKYLQAHGEELKKLPLFMLNFDVPFSPDGSIGLNTGFGVPPSYTSARLNGLSQQAAEELGFGIKRIYLPVRAAADHIPWSRHGFEATGLVFASPFMHRSGDSVQRIEREALRRTGEVALTVVRELDRQLS
jgi:Peptidase family M28